MERKKRNHLQSIASNEAVSEVLGAILMLAIAVALFALVYIIVMAYPFNSSPPRVDIVGTIQGNTIVLEHRGGESISASSKVSVVVNGSEYSLKVSEYLVDTNRNNRWDVGEQLIYYPSVDIKGLRVEATVVDVNTNSIVMMEIIQQGGDTQIPLETTVNPISPYDQPSPSLSLTASGDFRLNNVTLFYRWSNDNSSWNGGLHVIYDSVDSNSSNMDGSTDKGVETNFANAQGITKDGNSMTIQETDTAGQDHKTAITGNTCNVDSSPDKGTETNFVNAQGTSRDTNNMVITEVTSGLPAVNEHLYVDSFTATTTGWTNTGTTPYLSAIDGTNYIQTSTNGRVGRWFTFTNTASTGNILTVALSIYVTAGDGDDDVTWSIDTNGDNTAEYTGTINNPVGSNWYSTGTIAGLTTSALVNSSRASFTYVRSLPANIIRIDCAQLNVTRTSTINYQIDFEYNWTKANNSDTTEYLCFYVTSHTGSETLNINYRNGTTWTNLGTITTTGWKNITATGLTSKTYTIQIIGTTETSDTTQDTWNIDCIFLHSYNTSNYQIDIEYQWIAINYTQVNKQVCFYITSHTGTENLLVNYWTGSAWSLLGTITSTGWSNFTATGLSSSPYTIQLKGVTESSDIVKDTWNIDVIMLRTWNGGIWYDANWAYRKKINITGQIGAGPNYQVLLNIGETSGASGVNFNLGGHSSNFPTGKNTGGDLGFTNKSDTVPLDFWVEDISGIAPNRVAKVWVEVKDSLDSSSTIYCYYGNPSATNASNGTNTFNFFDNFDDNSIDVNKWTTYQGTWSETGRVMKQTSTATGDPKKCIAKSASQSDYYAIRAKVRPDSGTSSDARAGLSIKTDLSNGQGLNYVFHDFNAKTTDQFLDDLRTWGTSYSRAVWSFGTWYWFEIYHDGTNVNGRIWDINSTPGGFHSWARGGRSGYPALNGGSMGETASFDDVFVRKCIENEPSYSSAGNEETLSINNGEGHNWSIYTGDINPDSNSPWLWSFDFPNNIGYYEFYSRGMYNGVAETAPINADASCKN
ncbi:MAG TPA: hypothetical protein DSN98_01985 [Thermoplasmata archaeon]|nr:MAG TPA: hypothetical protein DSN98_01985 [Thermoplasmata archaeon]